MLKIIIVFLLASLLCLRKVIHVFDLLVSASDIFQILSEESVSLILDRFPCLLPEKI